MTTDAGKRDAMHVRSNFSSKIWGRRAMANDDLPIAPPNPRGPLLSDEIIVRIASACVGTRHITITRITMDMASFENPVKSFALAPGQYP